VSWFPGHMAKASKEVGEMLRKVDIVLEIRDARVPLSSSASHLQELLRQTNRADRHLVLLNKADLISAKQREWTKRALGDPDAMFVSAMQKKGMPEVLSRALEGLRRKSPKLFRTYKELVPAAGGDAQPYEREMVGRSEASLPLIMMVVGVPNTGKSSLINALRLMARTQSDSPQRSRKPARTGWMPGVTKKLHGFQVSWPPAPAIWMLDTPGVLSPKIDGGWLGAMRLGATDLIKHEQAGLEDLASFILHHLACYNMEQLEQFPRAHALARGTVDDSWRESWESLGTTARRRSKRRSKAAATRVTVGSTAVRRLQPAASADEGRGAASGGMPVEESERLSRHEELGMQLLDAVTADMKLNLFKNGSPDLHGAAGRVLKLMREGRLGRLCFDLHD